MEEGASAALPDDELGLVVGEPSTFRFFASTSRKDDVAGTLVDPDAAALIELAPVEQEVEVSGARAAGDVVPVALTAHVTEVGTLERGARPATAPAAGSSSTRCASRRAATADRRYAPGQEACMTFEIRYCVM